MTTGDSGRIRMAVVYGLAGIWWIALIAGTVKIEDGPWSTLSLMGVLSGLTLLIVSGILRSWLAAVYGVLLITALILCVGGIVENNLVIAAQGTLAIVVVGATAPISFVLADQSRSRGLDGAGADEGGGDVTSLLRQIHEHSMLSDSAKRVLYRDRELAFLRQAIEADIARGAYNASMALCDEMGEVFGYREEAEAYRTKVMQASAERRDQEIGHALALFEQQLLTHDWREIYEQAARFKRLFPEAYMSQQIEQRILLARNHHKQDLEQQFVDAAQREDVPQAMALLRELDRYMNRSEAARLAEVASDVVTKYKDNLGVQFKMAVNDRRWAEAAQFGDVITNEFPNTKMADEVRSMIEVIRTRAADAAVGPQPD